VELGQRRGAGDRRGDAGPRHLPGQCHLGRGGLVGLGRRVQRGQDAPAAFVEVRGLHPGAARAFRQVGLAAVLAGEKTARQAEEVDHAQAFAPAQRFQVALVRRAVAQVVQRLQGLVARQLQPCADVERLLQPRRAVVAGTDGAHLAFADQLGVGRKCLLQRRGRVVVVRLVQVDVVGLQPAQRVLHRLPNVGPRQADPAVAHVLADLGGQHDALALAAAPQPLADHRFALAAHVAGHPARVDVGRVHQVEAGVDECVEQRERGRRVRCPAEHVAAEGQRSDLQAAAAERAKLHASSWRGTIGRARAC